MEYQSNKVRHLEIIQGVIDRMSHNSLVLKGYALFFAGILLLMQLSITEEEIAIILCLALLPFWLLDSYYLLPERRFRYLYEQVLTKNDSEIYFSLQVTKPKGSGNFKIQYESSFINIPTAGFYVPVGALVGVLGSLLA